MFVNEKKQKISVIIVSRNRSIQLYQCLEALKKNSFKQIEVIVVDQSLSKDDYLKALQYKNYFPKFRYIESKKIGKSRGLNEAIRLCSCSILAFTDDDCMPQSVWLEEIFRTFNDNPKILGAFGATYPYLPTKKNGSICPSIFVNNKAKNHRIEYPCKHWESIGFGNNMAFKKSVFEEFGGFCEWLGPGSIGGNAEDAEMAFRVLKSGGLIHYNHNMKVYHDRWITLEQSRTLSRSYIRGEFACYGYLALTGERFARNVITNIFGNSFFLTAISNIKHRRITYFVWFFKAVYESLFGFIVAMMLALMPAKISPSVTSKK